MKDCIKILTEDLAPLTSKIATHPFCDEIHSISDIRLFMEQHVFAVWDFMCLLKELHRKIVSTSAPWFPPKDAFSANLISSILVEEEGDLMENGTHYACHYDIYIAAMKKVGANTFPIEKLLALLLQGHSIVDALNLINIRTATRNFVLTTFSFFKLELHEIAAAFVYGREGITAPMFLPMLKRVEEEMKDDRECLSTVSYYFQRHIALDDNEHFPKALTMLSNLIGDDEKKLQEAKQAAIKALTARLDFLSDIQRCLTYGKAVA